MSTQKPAPSLAATTPSARAELIAKSYDPQPVELSNGYVAVGIRGELADELTPLATAAGLSLGAYVERLIHAARFFQLPPKEPTQPARPATPDPKTPPVIVPGVPDEHGVIWGSRASDESSKD